MLGQLGQPDAAAGCPRRVDEKAEPDAGALVGSPAFLCDALRGFQDLGFTAFNLMPVGDGRDEQIERLAREVVPALR
ncbi:hypothetical protein [Nonomuraea longicatena]|uniref:Uncharacterized protein n=1 Tax=Nonomuraea longicatena TaxID=83682 RepID=A0ABN1PA22_9ACTN